MFLAWKPPAFTLFHAHVKQKFCQRLFELEIPSIQPLESLHYEGRVQLDHVSLFVQQTYTALKRREEKSPSRYTTLHVFFCFPAYDFFSHSSFTFAS